MNIYMIQSAETYNKLVHAPRSKRDDLFRYELLQPFLRKWHLTNVPFKAAVSGGYDTIMAMGIMGALVPKDLGVDHIEQIEKIEDEELWRDCKCVIEEGIKRFETIGYNLPIEELRFTILLGDPNNPYIQAAKGYLGDGGIPGYIIMILHPTVYSLERMKAAVAHEFNHQVRMSKELWNPGITLGEFMVVEGLAEMFATEMCGKELIGEWVKHTSKQEIVSLKDAFYKALGYTGFETMVPYLYGDECAMAQGYEPVGVPYCGGYAMGYALVEYYLSISGKSIEEATLTPGKEILQRCEGFWDE